MGVQRFEHTSDLQIHVFNHVLVGFLRAAIEVIQIAVAQAIRFRLVARRLPGPVWRIEMQAEQEGLARFRVAIHHIYRVAAEQIGQVAHLVNCDVVVPEFVPMVRAGMHVIVECAATEAVEMVVAAFQGAELGKNTEVPLSDEGCTVAGLPKQRW